MNYGFAFDTRATMAASAARRVGSAVPAAFSADEGPAPQKPQQPQEPQPGRPVNACPLRVSQPQEPQEPQEPQSLTCNLDRSINTHYLTIGYADHRAAYEQPAVPAVLAVVDRLNPQELRVQWTDQVLTRSGAFLDDEPIDADAIEERAAIVEYDGGIPRAWAEGFARLHPDRPPADVPAHRWRCFIDDVGLFLDSPFCQVAGALGWTAFDLFGADRDRPFARIDQLGLLWLLNGSRLVMLTDGAATIERRSGARQTWRRTPTGEGQVLAWELSS